MGSLESSVLEELWRSSEAMTPAQVQTAIDGDLAYTTVMTILSRLWKKGQVTRSRVGRAFAYTPTLPQAEFLAERMGGELERTRDHSAVLTQFVDKLSKTDTEALRAMLSELDD